MQSEALSLLQNNRLFFALTFCKFWSVQIQSPNLYINQTLLLILLFSLDISVPRNWSVHDTNLHSFHIPFAYFNISGHLLRTPKEECGRQQSKVKTLLLHRFALSEFHVTDSQNTRDHITSDRRSKRAWSNCVLCIPFIVSRSPEWDKC